LIRFAGFAVVVYLIRKRFTDTYTYDHSLFNTGPRKLTTEEVLDAEAATPVVSNYGSVAVDSDSVEDLLIPQHERVLETKPVAVVEVEMI
jgi:hypothetical protein